MTERMSGFCPIKIHYFPLDNEFGHNSRVLFGRNFNWAARSRKGVNSQEHHKKERLLIDCFFNISMLIKNAKS